VDVLVLSMLVNFLVMCLTVLALPWRNPALATEVGVIRSRGLQVAVALSGTALLGLFLFVHVRKDLATEVAAWYVHSTWVWLLVMALASGVYVLKVRGLQSRGVDVDALFSTLPPE
jgi:hypothetical protein